MIENEGWRSIIRKLKPQATVLVAVHPTYGQELVGTETFLRYFDGFTETWTAGHFDQRVLVSGSPNDYYVTSFTGKPPDYITSAFPKPEDLSNQSYTVHPHIFCIGSTARTHGAEMMGCVDTVAHGLLAYGFCSSVTLLSSGILYPNTLLTSRKT